MERADSSCLTPVETESVGGQQVALWKGQPEPEEVSLNATRTIAITLISVTAVMVLSRWIVARIMVGDYLPGKAFAFVVMGSPLIIFALILFSRRPLRHATEPLIPSCIDFPRAVPVSVSLSSGSSHRGGSKGWLFISDGLLTFRGEYFDFALRPEDFKKPKDLPSQFSSQGAAILTPDGVSAQYMRVRFLTRIDGKWESDATGKERFKRDLEVWQEGRPAAASLFPPLRYSNTPIRLRGVFLGFGAIGLLLSGIIWQLPFILGTTIFEGRNTWGIGLGVLGLMMFIPIQLALVAHSGKPFDREVEKVLERERKGV